VSKPYATWIRHLTLYREERDPLLAQLMGPEPTLDLDDPALGAWSRFRSLTHPQRLALYAIRLWEPEDTGGTAGAENHTLVVVREFRRVPLQASTLGLMLFEAQPGRSAEVAATLALFVEQAVSVYRPAYLLLAHSLEQPRLGALLTGVREPNAMVDARPAAFSLDRLLPELRPLLAHEPDWYAYCPDREHVETPVAPWAV
jgi:hypothetical protein